jgi:hypothetical protein
MNFSFYIFGTPSGYDQFPLDEKSNLFREFSQNGQNESQIIIYRTKMLIYYTYVRKFHNDNYFGISLIVNGIYCQNTKKLFDFFDKFFSDIAAKGELIKLNSNGKLAFKTKKFLDKQQELDSIKTRLQSAIDNQFENDFIPIDSSFCISKGSTTLPITKENEDIIDAIRKNKYVFIIGKNKAKGKKTKKRTMLYGVIILVCILVSFVAWLSLPNKGQPNYEIKLQPSDAVDLPFIFSGDTFSYTGSLKNELPHGYGVAEFSDSDSFAREKYEGSFIDGYRDGKGKLTYKKQKKGRVYDGDFVKNKFEGHGLLTYEDGSFYNGDFSNNLQNGLGTYFDKESGDTIQGIFKNGTIQ